MKWSRKAILVALVLMVGLSLWLIFSNNEPSPEYHANLKQVKSEQLDDYASVAIKKKTSNARLSLETEDDEFNPYQNEEIKASLQQVADVYEESIKYPIGSQPISHPDQVKDYEPFEQSEVDLPFPKDDSDKNPIRIAASTNTFQYFQGDTILARVQISGAPQDTFIDVKGVISGTNGDVPIEAAFQPSDPSLTQFTASFDTNLAPANLMTKEMLLKLNVNIGGRDLVTTVAFRYAVASAQIIGVQPSKPQGPELLIPLQVNVFQTGYYFVSGVLEDAATGQPLIQLQAEGRLNSGNALINLKAHITALKHKGSEGPYVLRSIRIYRGAEIGESFDAPASTTQPRFGVQGFPFSVYEDVDYVDELAQERLEFLRGLGSVDNEQARERQQQRLNQEQLAQEQPFLLEQQVTEEESN